MTTSGLPIGHTAGASTALQSTGLLQSQFQAEHKPKSLQEVDRTCMFLWLSREKEKVCTNCSPYLVETEVRSGSSESTGSSTSVAPSSSSSSIPATSSPALAVKQGNPMLMSSQLDFSSLPPFITVQSSKTFIIRMMHLWIATAGTWLLEKGWNWTVDYLEVEDWLKLTPTHTTLWVAIASSVYLVATHTLDWIFPNSSSDTLPTRTYLKTLKILTFAHVAAAITCYFKLWVNPIQGLTCMGITFALPYGKIEAWGGIKK